MLADELDGYIDEDEVEGEEEVVIVFSSYLKADFF